MTRAVILFLILALPAVLAAQDKSGKTMREHAAELHLLRQAVLKAQTPEARTEHNKKFIAALESTLNMDSSFVYAFTNLGKTMAILSSPDQRVRIWNWNLPLEDEEHRYFCYVQLHDPATGNLSWQAMQENEKSTTGIERRQLTPKNWYGALYYDLIQLEVNKQPHYTLLGWNGNGRLTNKKLIEVMTVANGKIKFGANVFKGEQATNRRIIFEYSSEAVMSLKWHPEVKQIVFDHLSPRDSSMVGMYQYYGPDFRYDAFRLKKDKWVYLPDIDTKAVSNPEERPWNDPEKKGDE